MIKVKEIFPSFEEFNALLVDAWGITVTRDRKTYKSMKKATNFSVTAFDGDKCIGMARIVGDGYHYMVYDVVVLKDYQNKGIGLKIMTRLLELFNSLKGRRNLSLGASKGIEPFYEKLGFKTRPFGESVGAGMNYVPENT